MPPRITNIHTSPFVDTPTQRGGLWRHLDLGGDHLGVRIEVLLPGGTSSVMLENARIAFTKADEGAPL